MLEDLKEIDGVLLDDGMTEDGLFDAHDQRVQLLLGDTRVGFEDLDLFFKEQQDLVGEACCRHKACGSYRKAVERLVDPRGLDV